MIPLSTASASALSIGNEVNYEVIINKYNKYKENNMKEINKQLNILISYTENLYKIM